MQIKIPVIKIEEQGEEVNFTLDLNEVEVICQDD